MTSVVAEVVPGDRDLAAGDSLVAGLAALGRQVRPWLTVIDGVASRWLVGPLPSST